MTFAIYNLNLPERGEGYLEISLSGKELESETAKYKRYRLAKKTFYGGIEEVEEFVGKLYLKGEEKLTLAKVRSILNMT